ncbi:hypothetical protein D8S78_01180 [Natrialba swarupiae]|nr:hypothetical protein [Natrialba swarupiae]
MILEAVVVDELLADVGLQGCEVEDPLRIAGMKVDEPGTEVTDAVEERPRRPRESHLGSSDRPEPLHSSVVRSWIRR